MSEHSLSSSDLPLPISERDRALFSDASLVITTEEQLTEHMADLLSDVMDEKRAKTLSDYLASTQFSEARSASARLREGDDQE